MVNSTGWCWLLYGTMPWRELGGTNAFTTPQNLTPGPQRPRGSSSLLAVVAQDAPWWSNLRSLLLYSPPSNKRNINVGSCFKRSPQQGDKSSSPSTTVGMQLELETCLTVSCVVAVALVYNLCTVSALDSVLSLKFANALVLFGWKDFLVNWKKHHTTN